MISMVVVLPAPLGPRSPKQVPSGTAKETPSTAVTPGYCLTRWWASRITGTASPGRTRRMAAPSTGIMEWPGILPPRFDDSNMVTSQLPLWSDRDATEGWSVRESQRARRLTVRVFHTGRVEVVVPYRTSQRAIERFLERHRPWIERKREEARRRVGPPVPF